MRFMMIIKATTESESGAMPKAELLEAMGRYDEELVKAGVMLGGEGLHPSAKGVRLRFANGARTVVQGPFPEVNELIAGFWLIQVRSKEEAVEWASRIPGARGELAGASEFEIELRQVHDTADFDYAPEVQAKETELRKAIEARKGS